MKLQTIAWKHGAVELIDQTKLPKRLTYIRCTTVQQVWEAIKVLRVRGAPAIGAAGALGLVLGVYNKKYKKVNDLYKDIEKNYQYLATSRPTAVNLFWALERTKRSALNSNSIEEIKKNMLDVALAIMNEDKISCRKMAEYSQELIKNGDNILTYCNAGLLATVDYGTAVGCLYRAKEKGKNIKVYSCETRPLLQGARLTCWELKRHKIDVTLLCDNMAGYLMQQKKIDKILVGADRIARNGDAANKIGSYSLSVLANFHKIPFYVVAPLSTFDAKLKTGKEIPIEQRDKKEVSELFYKQSITAKGVKIYNPAFDVVPNKLIRAIVTDKGLIKFPFSKKITRLLASNK